MRISIIGFSGSGKTRLAKALSKQLSIPHLHMDRLWISLGGHNVEKSNTELREAVSSQIKAHVIQFIAQKSWVTDGWYYQSQIEIAKRATIIIFLDISLWRRIINHLHRTFTPNDRHPEFSIFDNILFLYQLVKRTWVYKKKMNELMKEHKEKLVVLKSRQEIEQYLVTMVGKS